MTDLVGAVSQQGSGLIVSPVCLPGPAWSCTTHGSWEAPGTHMLVPFLQGADGTKALLQGKP